MRRFLKFISVIFAIFLLFDYFYPGVSIPYRITIEVETPDGVKSNSGVWKHYVSMKAYWFSGFLEGGDLGEAVFVDLGERGTLFAILAERNREGKPVWPSFDTLLRKSFGVRRVGNPRRDVYALSSLEGTADVPSKLIPFLVRFRDLNNPRSVEAVDPENLEASFGPGVSLKRVTVEMLSEWMWPLNLMFPAGGSKSQGIEKKLHWLGTYPSDSLDPDGRSGGLLSAAPLNQLLYQTYFKRGR